mmetsp:Transcript_22656/g.33122  ORF Transcript_22656/g.33122 Transcript_22656/m.33122 type:complete len:320 (+) Transcript_22656:72-1031(+)
MGAGASVNDLPEKLTREQIEEICGDRFDETYYEMLKDDDGFSSRDVFLSMFADEQDREVFFVFNSYSKDGHMRLKDLKHLLRDSKCFRKGEFTACDLADIDKVCVQEGRYSTEINYFVFRQYILPMIAEKKKTSVQHLIYKISQCDHKPEGELAVEVEVPAAVPDDLQNTAALKLQRVHRSKEAMKDAKTMREIKLIKDNEFDSSDGYAELTDNTTLEDALVKLYDEYTYRSDGTLTKDRYLKMLKERDIYSRKFTAKDARIVYKKTVAKALSRNAPDILHNSVFLNKHIRYQAFRRITIPLIANMKQLTVEECIDYFV